MLRVEIMSHFKNIFNQDEWGGQASFELPNTVPAASVEDMIKSGYKPDTPSDLALDTDTEDVVTVTWSHVHCAQLYDVTYTSVTTNTMWSVQVKDKQIVSKYWFQACDWALVAVFRVDYY